MIIVDNCTKNDIQNSFPMLGGQKNISYSIKTLEFKTKNVI